MRLATKRATKRSDRKPARLLINPTTEQVRKHMPIVHQMVGRFLRRLPPNVLRDDVQAAAMYGLVDSLRKNGGDGGRAFEWYTRTRIRGAILDELRTQDWLSRRARWIATGKKQASARNTTPAMQVVGFDDLAPADRPAQFVDESVSDPSVVAETAQQSIGVRCAVDRLPDRERTIVQLHYFQGMKFKEIGRILGASEPRISQLHGRAVERLRGQMDDLREAA